MSKIKNGDMSAMPTQVNGGDIYGGLTKREYAKIHAPAMPDWFSSRQEGSFKTKHKAWLNYFADMILGGENES